MTIEKRLPEMTREKRRLEITMGKNSLSFLGSEPFVISRERQRPRNFLTCRRRFLAACGGSK
jgi:hypothetical protein